MKSYRLSLREARQASEASVFLTGTANPFLAENVSKELTRIIKKKTTLLCPITTFADGEIRVRIPANVRKKHVMILQPTCPPDVNRAVMELVFMIDAAKRASAREITAVIPYFGYSRQDRKDKPRVPISAAVITSILAQSGVNRIVTLDIHSEQQQGFFPGAWDNLYATYSLLPAIKAAHIPSLVIVSPDAGGTRRAEKYASALGGVGIATVYKKRDLDKENVSEALSLMGNVANKNVLLVDDMIDTAGSLTHAAALLQKVGAKHIYAAAAHGLFSSDALEKIKNSVIKKIFITDSLFHSPEVSRDPKIEIVSIAPLIAEAMLRIECGETLSEAFIIK